MDNDVTVAQLQEAVKSFVDAHHSKENHSPKTLSMSIAVEAAGLMKHFQWHNDQKSQDYLRSSASYSEVSDELADIMIYCLAFANQTSIDISSAIQRKLAKKELRFPKESS